MEKGEKLVSSNNLNVNLIKREQPVHSLGG